MNLLNTYGVAISGLSLNDRYSSSTHLDCAICELAQSNTEQALDQLFYIQEHTADYKDGAAKEMVIAIVEATASIDPDAARKYRAKLTALMET